MKFLVIFLVSICSTLAFLTAPQLSKKVQLNSARYDTNKPWSLDSLFDAFKPKPSSSSFGSSSSNNSGEVLDALVVGSGISGSTAAFYLNKKGLKVVLAESRDVVGGNLISKRG